MTFKMSDAAAYANFASRILNDMKNGKVSGFVWR